MQIIRGLLLTLLLVPLVVRAQDFPTVTALEETLVSPRDQVALAQRLLGVTEIAPPPENPPPLEVGTVDSFWVTNSAEDRSFEVNAELRVVGEHIYLWVDQRAENVNQAGLEQLATEFDRGVYQQTRDLWGSEPNPGVDGDPRVHGLFAQDVGAGIGAYYASKHAVPAEAVPTSNEREMFVYNLDAFGSAIGTPLITSVTAHEFQHMIRANVDPNEDGWMDEGFSEFTQLYLGDVDLSAASIFQGSSGTQLNTWTEDGFRAADYGASLLWVTYIYERYGLDAIHALSADPANGLVAVDNLLRERGEPDANTLFADWVLANMILDKSATPDGIYGYDEIRGLPSPLPEAVPELPYENGLEINQYATRYLLLQNISGVQELKVTLNTPTTAQLVPAEAASGQHAWYSNRGDDSNTYMTRRFDLSDVDSATLAYSVWYHIENLWDYGYVMASRDGQNWTPLFAQSMTTENPHFNAYGPGYTGRSEGWLRESVSLDDYVGGEVFIRFELINDDAINQPGLLIDDVAIPEIGYSDDFENGPGGWESNGWIYSDNMLPQRVWVQAVQFSGTDAKITRWLAQDNKNIWTLPVHPDADFVWLAVSPFAPTTTVPVGLTLSISDNVQAVDAG